ncbi:MAG: hypothetical protein KJ000_26995 [Pirellulaceae bacterium]|nr:hypothetical protein [Pirellulaceae bacterium]
MAEATRHVTIVVGSLLSLAAMFGAAPALEHADVANEVTLENASTRVVLRDGRIVSLLDKARSVQHVSPEADPDRGLFRIQLVDGVQPAGEVDAAQMTSQVSHRAADAAEIEFEHPRVTARVRVRLSPSPGETHWWMAAEPKDAALAVGQVTFPVLLTPRSTGGEEKRYLFPMFEGRFSPLSQPPMWRPYPAHLFAQMIACVGAAGGFLLWTDDGEGQVKAFGFTNLRSTAMFGVRHQMPYEPARRWEMPYHTRLSFCGGTWQDAAEVYRVWATAQPWSNTPLRERQDAPELLRHPPLCISTQIEKEDLTDLPDRLAAWGERFDVPIIYRPLGWEKHGNWVGIDYFPPSIGEDQFRTLASRLKERGITVSGFISGYRWTTHSQGASSAGNRELAGFFAQQDGDRNCERMRNGELLTFQSEGRDSHRLCRGTSAGRTFLPETARSLFDLGVAVIHDDQDHGPYPDGVESCFDATHGHPVPCGPWSTAVTRESFREIRAEAARRGLTDFFVTKESCSELLNMDIHAYQARFFHESTTPGLVPLAQYLYHEHVPVIFGWVTANSRSSWDLAAMLIYGQVPSLAFWNAAADRPDAMPPGGLRLLGDYFAAMETHAKPFLLYGRMRPPLIVDAPSLRREVRQIRGRELRQPQVIDVPQVIQSAWDDGLGGVGVFAVNTLEQAVTLRVRVPEPGRWRATVHAGASREEQHDAVAGDLLSWPLSPGRLGAVVFQRRDETPSPPVGVRSTGRGSMTRE